MEHDLEIAKDDDNPNPREGDVNQAIPAAAGSPPPNTRARCKSLGVEVPEVFNQPEVREEFPVELRVRGILPSKGYPFLAVYKDKDTAVRAARKQLNAARKHMSFSTTMSKVTTSISDLPRARDLRVHPQAASTPVKPSNQVTTKALVHEKPADSNTPENREGSSASSDSVFATPFTTPMNTGYSHHPGRLQNEEFKPFKQRRKESRSASRENQLKRAEEIMVDPEGPEDSPVNDTIKSQSQVESRDRRPRHSSSSPELPQALGGDRNGVGMEVTRSESGLDQMKLPPTNSLHQQTGKSEDSHTESSQELDRVMLERRELMHRAKELELDVMSHTQGLERRLQGICPAPIVQEYEESRVRCWQTLTQLTKWAQQMQTEGAISVLKRVRIDLTSLYNLITTARQRTQALEAREGALLNRASKGRDRGDWIETRKGAPSAARSDSIPVRRDLLAELLDPTPGASKTSGNLSDRGGAPGLRSLATGTGTGGREGGGGSLFNLAQREREKRKSRPQEYGRSSQMPSGKATLASLGDRTLAMSTLRWGTEDDPEVEAGDEEDRQDPEERVGDARSLLEWLRGVRGGAAYAPEYLLKEGEEFYRSLPSPWDVPPKHSRPRDYEMKALDSASHMQNFSGKQEDYVVFRTRFLLLVHRLDVPIERKQICLATAVSQVNGGNLSRFATPDENGYRLIITQLEAKFGDPQKNLQAHLTRVQALPVTGDHNVTALERFIETVESYHAALGAAAPAEIDSAAHFHLLASKLESRVMVGFRKTLNTLGLGDRPNDPKLLLMYLEEFVLEPLRKAMAGPSPDHPAAAGNKGGKAGPGGQGRAQKQYHGRLTEAELDEVLPSEVDRSNLANTRDCPLCVASHSLAQCPHFLNKMNVNQRKSLLIHLDRCFSCLEAGHRNPDCPRPKRCNICPETQKGDHHPLLHGAVHWRVNRKGGKPKKGHLNGPEKRGSPKEDENTKGNAHQSNKMPSREDMAKAAAAPYHFMIRVETPVARESHWSLGVQLPPCFPGKETDYTNMKPYTFTHPFHGGTSSLGFVGAKLYGRSINEVRHTVIMLDPGANVTLMRESVLQDLKVPAEFGEARVVGVGGHVTTYRSAAVSLTLESLNGNYRAPIQARTMPEPVGDLRPTRWNEYKSHWKHLSNLNFGEFPTDAKVDIIMGTDNPLFHWCLEEIWGESIYDPFARLTVLGWAGYGPMSPEHLSQKTQANVAQGFKVEELKDLAVDEVPAAAGRKICNAGDKRAIHLLQETTRMREDGKLETSLLWKDDAARPAPNGREIWNRYQREQKKLEIDPVYWERYDRAIAKWLEGGVIRELKDGSLDQGYYIPHFGVVREDKETTKLRVVLNCAYKSADGYCINDFFVKGPRVFNDLVNVLILFRGGEIGLMADIKEMFLQLKLRPEDREYIRILFRRYQSKEITIYECLAHMFGLADSPCISVALLKRAALLKKEEAPVASKAVVRQSIIDDILACVRNALEGHQVKRDLIAIAGSLGMRIHKWASNCPELMAPEDRDMEYLEFRDQDPEKEESQALGLLWKLREDVLTFKERSNTPKEWTLRGVLSLLNSQFDPLGLVLPFVMTGRMLFTRTRQTHKEWDSELDEQERKEWQKWAEQIPMMTQVSVRRWTRLEEGSQLHVFGDASNDGYGCVAYLVQEGISTLLFDECFRVRKIR